MESPPQEETRKNWSEMIESWVARVILRQNPTREVPQSIWVKVAVGKYEHKGLWTFYDFDCGRYQLNLTSFAKTSFFLQGISHVEGTVETQALCQKQWMGKAMHYVGAWPVGPAGVNNGVGGMVLEGRGSEISFWNNRSRINWNK